MKLIKFLTLVLICNYTIAMLNDWHVVNTVLVIINSLAVLALIAVKLIYGRKLDNETKRNKNK